MSQRLPFVVVFFHRSFSFLRSMVSFSQMRGFSSFPQFWLLSCSWEQWVILLQYGYGVWGHFLLLSFLAGFCTACGARDLHARTTLLHSSAFYARIFAMLSRTLSLLDKTRNSRFRFFYLSSYASHSGEGSGCMDMGGDFTQWLWIRHQLRNGYQFTPNGFAYVISRYASTSTHQDQ